MTTETLSDAVAALPADITELVEQLSKACAMHKIGTVIVLQVPKNIANGHADYWNLVAQNARGLAAQIESLEMAHTAIGSKITKGTT